MEDGKVTSFLSFDLLLMLKARSLPDQKPYQKKPWHYAKALHARMEDGNHALHSR
jgi:hypothetical protein